ncbi:MAG: hypothetical protein ACK4J0_03925, partial [Candidatus Anstonellaceae archaeon]
GLLEASKKSFSSKDYPLSSNYTTEAENKFYLLNQSLYSNLSATLEQKLTYLNKQIRNISDINLAFKLKEDLDSSYLLLDKKEFFLVANKIKSMEYTLENYYKQQPQPKPQQVQQNTTFFDPEIERYRSTYFSFLEKIQKKKETLLKNSEELNYSINFIVFDQYFLAAKAAEKSLDFKKASDYLLEADNQLNLISEQLVQYNTVLKQLDEYKVNISQFTNSSTSLASLKLAKAYLIAKTNSTLALEEAQEALNLAKKESEFSVFFPSTKNYAFLVFFFIFFLVLLLAFFIFILLKNHLAKKIIKKEDFIIIKKAKSTLDKKRKG